MNAVQANPFISIRNDLIRSGIPKKIPKENVETYARYFFEQFGLFHVAGIRASMGEGPLRDCYTFKIKEVAQTYEWISQGRMGALEKSVMEETSAISSDEVREKINEKMRACFLRLPMAIQAAEEIQIRYKFAVPSDWLDKKRQTRLAQKLYEVVDISKRVELPPDELAELERFIFSDGAMATASGEVLNWYSLIHMWVREKRINAEAFEKLFKDLLALKQFAGQPAKKGSEEGFVEVEIDRMSMARQTETFHEFVAAKTHEDILRKLEVALPPELSERILDYLMQDELGRKTISHFIHLKDFETLKLADVTSGHGVFLHSLQKFLQFKKDNPCLGIGIVFGWLLSASLEDRAQFNPEGVVGALALNLMGQLAEERRVSQKDCLRVYGSIGKLSNLASFREFIEEVKKKKWFALNEQFLTACFKQGMNPPEYRSLLNVCQAISEILRRKEILGVSEGFWIEVCTQLSGVIDSEAKLREFFELFADGDVIKWEDLEAFILSFFKGDFSVRVCRPLARIFREKRIPAAKQEFWLKASKQLAGVADLEKKGGEFFWLFPRREAMSSEKFEVFILRYFKGEFNGLFGLIEILGKKIEWRFTDQEIIDTLLQVKQPVKTQDVPFCLQQIEALDKYELTPVEIGTLFFDFLSLDMALVVRDHILRLAMIEKFTRVQFNKDVVIGWLHFRPESIPIEGESKPVHIGKVLRDIFAYRDAIVRSHLNKTVIPYESLGLFHGAIASLQHAKSVHSYPGSNFKVAAEKVMEVLNLSLSIQPELFAGAISLKAHETGFFQLEGRELKMNCLIPLAKGHPRQIYCGISIPDDELVFEWYIVDSKSMETRGVRVKLELSHRHLKRDPKIFQIIQKAALILCNEMPEVERFDKDHPAFQSILRDSPHLNQIWQESKDINRVKEHADDYTTFLIDMLYYPSFYESWEQFTPDPLPRPKEPFIPPRSTPQKAEKIRAWDAIPMPPCEKEDIGKAIYRLVRTVKLEVRKSLLYFSGALGEELFYHTQYRRDLYPVPGGLSMLPDLFPHRTESSLLENAFREECNPVLGILEQIIQKEDVVEKRRERFPKGEIEIDYDPKNSRKLTLSMDRASHTLFYEGLQRKMREALRWHLAVLWMKR